ncbi:MAG TPA: hypothetical protein VID27_22395, partial [Blastocatellia bacterium]
MKISNTITKLLTVAICVAAITVIGVHRTAGQGVNTTSESHFIVGFAPGQTLRFSLFNPMDQGREPVSAQAYIYDSTGRLISQTEKTDIPAGQFRSLNINRDLLSEAGEAGTGRLQVRGVIQVAFSDGSVRTVSKSLTLSIEVIDNRNGANG